MIYENQYGVTFITASEITYDENGHINATGFHSFRDFGLYPVGKPVISPPEPKTMTVEIPGSDGVIDYTEALTGDVHYNTRRITMRYKIPGDRESWDDIYHYVLKNVHGKNLSIVLDEDPEGYYTGRFQVLEPEYEGHSAYFTIEGDVYPYMMDISSSLGDWLWDPFSFTHGVIREYDNISVTNSKTVTIIGCEMPVSPDVVLKSGSLTMQYPTAYGSTATVTLVSGSNAENTPDFIIREGEYTVKFTGTGVVDISYRVGKL